MKGQEKTKNPPNEQTLKKGTRGSRPLSPERRTKRKNNIQSLPGLHLAGRILLPKKIGYEIRGLNRSGVRQVLGATGTRGTNK